MHMADALLSAPVGLTMWAVSGGAIAADTARLTRRGWDDKKLPLMAVSGAFVFAAQMINFTIPGTGSSGHIGGGILLASLLGGGPALLTITAVLLIQCLLFADGGLLALGCNIFNMGVIPCLVIYPLLFRPLIRGRLSRPRLTLAAVVSCVVSLQLGAFAVVLETLCSGITALPFSTFVLLMQPIHLAIGLVEGLVTAAVLVFLRQMQPALLDTGAPAAAPLSLKRVVILLGVLALLTAGGLSLLASGNPDGLEWSIQKTTGSTEVAPEAANTDAAHDVSAQVQQATALLPDYETSPGQGGSTAGVIGAVVTFALAGACGWGICAVKKRRLHHK